MEGLNKTNKPQEQERKVEMQDMYLFGELLKTSRLALSEIESRSEMTSRLRFVKYDARIKWESGNGFPEKDKLPVIATAYGIDLNKLTEIWRISTEARDRDKGVRKDLRSGLKTRPSDSNSGGGSGRRIFPRFPRE